MEIKEVVAELSDEQKEKFGSYLESLTDMTTISKDNAQEFINKNQSLLSTLDKRVMEGVTKYKNEGFDIAVEKEVAKVKAELKETYDPTLTKDQIMIKELSDKVKASENREIFSAQEKVAKNLISSQEIDLSFFDVSTMVGMSDEETAQKVEKAITPYKEFHKKNMEGLNGIIQSKIDEVLKNGHTPIKDGVNDDKVNVNARLQDDQPLNIKEQAEMLKKIREDKNKR